MNIFNQINQVGMKTIFNKLMTAFMAIAVCLSIASCEEENGGETVDHNALKDIKAMYSLTVSEDYLYFYDLTVTYGYDDAKTTEEILLDGWSFEQTYSTDYMKTLPVRFFCTVKATPKSPVPAIEESKTYKFECSGACNLAGFTNDGRRIMSSNVPHNEKLQSGGSAMQSVLNKGTKTLVSFEFARE